MGLKVEGLFAEMGKHLDEKAMALDVAYYAWDKHLRAAAQKAVLSTDPTWDDMTFKAVDFLASKFLKPKV